MSNHLIIGLGGTGGRIIRAFRKIIYRDSGTVDPKGVTLEYLYIDSSKEMMPAEDPTWKVLDVSVQLNVADQLHLGGGDLQGRLKALANYPQLRAWIGDIKHWTSILNLGAGETTVLGGQKRILGRFLLSCKITEFLDRLTAKMNRLRQQNNSHVTAHIFTGLAGGTGSGCMIDVIAQIRSRYPEKDCTIYVYTLLPERYPKDGWAEGNYHANGYAALSELNALAVGKYLPYNLAGQGERLKNLEGAFQACYVITNENCKEMQFDVAEQMPESIAMFLYQKVVAGAKGEWPEVPRIEKWENKDLEPEAGERCRLFISFGIKQINYPVDEIRDYLGYALAQQACAQVLYNNWAKSFLEEAPPFSGEAYVRQPQVVQQWCLTRPHLFLEENFTLDELDGQEQQTWRPLKEVWGGLVSQILNDVKDQEKGNSAAVLRKRCKDYFESGFCGGLGVKGFYGQRCARLEEYASTIRSRIEGSLLKDLFEGRQSLTSSESILTALRQQLKVWVTDWATEAEVVGRLAAKAKVKLDKNVEEFECMGPLAKLFGLRSRILEATRDNAMDYYLSLSQVEGAAFAQKFARTIEQALGDSLSALATFAATVRESSRFCREKCANLKPKVADETVQQFEARLKGGVVSIFDAKEVEKNLMHWIQDEKFQIGQAEEARKAVRNDLLLNRLEFRYCAKLTSDGLRDCLINVAIAGLKKVDTGERDARLGPLLHGSIVDKLNERYHGNDDLMRKEVQTIVESATDFVVFNDNQCSLKGIGTVEDRKKIFLAIAIPDFELNKDSALKKRFDNTYNGISWVDTAKRRVHEISLLKFTSLFPLRYLEAVVFLRERYEALLKESRNSEQVRLELHTDPSAKNHPSLFAPDPTQILLPKIMLGAATAAITVRQSELILNYDPNDGNATIRVESQYSLGKNYSEAVAFLNVKNIKVHDKQSGETSRPAHEILQKETDLLLKSLTSDEDRKALQEKVVAQIDLLLDKGDESSRDHLSRAAADAVRWLDEQWKTQN